MFMQPVPRSKLIISFNIRWKCVLDRGDNNNNRGGTNCLILIFIIEDILIFITEDILIFISEKQEEVTSYHTMRKLEPSMSLALVFCLCFLHYIEAVEDPFGCSKNNCTETCQYGFVKDKNGCDTCTCSYPCETMICPMKSNCSSIHIIKTGTYQHKCLDNDGAVKCRAVDSAVMCMMHCEYGFERDEDGCDVCKCRYPCNQISCLAGQKCVVNNDTKVAECKPLNKEDKCSGALCKMLCEFGFMSNDKGCSICACYWPCRDVVCPPNTNCTETKRDNMTYVGICRPTGALSCPILSCPNVTDIKCQYGHIKDIHGCDTCNCREPCSGITCDMGKVCTPQRIDNTSVFVGKCLDNQECLDDPCDFYCEFGYVTTSGNCKVCSCTDPCQGLDCAPLKCRPKTLLGSGGQIYGSKCTDDECPTNICNMTCEYGNKLDSLGCPMCACHDPCSICSPGQQCQPHKLGNLYNNYEVRCSYSTLLASDPWTSPLRDVLTPTSPDPCTHVKCTTGTTCILEQNRVNELVGNCKPCPAVICNNFCYTGYMKTRQGCSTCDCNPDPCEGFNCEFGTKCAIHNYSAQCRTILHPCMENECRLECAGLGDLNLYKLNCTGCPCDNPCYDANCESTMCYFNQMMIKVGRRDVSITVGRCNHNELCPSVTCDVNCPLDFVKDKYGCKSCKCSDGCKKKICKKTQYCTSSPRLSFTGFGLYKVVDYETQCNDCPNLKCTNDNICLYGYQNCWSCKCAENPCLFAGNRSTKFCLPLYFPIYAQPDDLLNPNQNNYQDYVYLDINSISTCQDMNSRYLDYLNISESLNCKESGKDFKPLQCARGACWCLRADGGMTDIITTENINDVICGFHSKEFLLLRAVDDISIVPDHALKRGIPKALATLIKIPDDQVIVLNISDKIKSPVVLNLVYLVRSEGEEASALNNIVGLSMNPLNISIEDGVFKFSLDRLSALSLSTPLSASPSSTPSPFISTPPHHSDTSSDEEQEDMTRFYLLVILLPILVVLFVVMFSLLVGICVLRKLNKRAGPSSLFKEPIIFQESPRNSIPYEPNLGSEA